MVNVVTSTLKNVVAKHTCRCNSLIFLSPMSHCHMYALAASGAPFP